MPDAEVIKVATLISCILHLPRKKKTKTVGVQPGNAASKTQTNEAELQDSVITLQLRIANPLLYLDLQNFKWLTEGN